MNKTSIDDIWNDPINLNLLDMKKSSLIPIITNKKIFHDILPCIRRLYIIFDSICPNKYRLYCSDSIRILNEILCLINEYLHITPENFSTNQLLFDEKSFDKFISKLQDPSVVCYRMSSSIANGGLHCFGQGIQAYNHNNQLNQTILFCFELTTENFSLPIHVLILDPDENIVLNDMKYINTYNQGRTKLFSCSYTPKTKTGIYKISFIYNNNQITNQQYPVYIHNSNKEQLGKTIQQITIPEYELEGDGCSKKVLVNSIARFRLRIKSSINSYNNNSIIDLFSISIYDPYGHKIVVQRRILSYDLVELTYQPMSIGEYELIILFKENILQQKILNIINDDINYLSKLKPFGPGLKRGIMGLPTEFYVDLNQTSINNNIHFRLEPSYQAEIDYEQQMATVRYIPMNEGNCPIDILENDKEISHLPYIAHIETNSSLREKPRIRVIGLSKKLILHRPMEFQVYVDNPSDDLTHTLHIDILTNDDKISPSVSIRRRHRSSYSCSFIPDSLGKYIISIDYAGIVAEYNPFHCEVIQGKDILLNGPAMTNRCLKLNEPTHFCFSLKEFLTTNFSESTSTYESGYSSNDDISSSSSSSTTTINEDEKNYHVTITDGHGNIKSNISVQELLDKKPENNNNNNIRVDFTPDEKILYINVSCTW